jgi:hypothetical protein
VRIEELIPQQNVSLAVSLLLLLSVPLPAHSFHIWYVYVATHVAALVFALAVTFRLKLNVRSCANFSVELTTVVFW